MIICMAVASVVLLLFAFLFITANNNIAGLYVNCCIESENEKVKRNRFLLDQMVNDSRHSNGQIKNSGQMKKLKKEINVSQKRIETLEKGKISTIDLVPLAGYRLIQLLSWDSANNNIKKLYNKCIQFKERKEAMNYAYFLLSSLLGYMMVAVLFFFAMLGLGLAMGLGKRSIIIAIAAFIAFALLGYLPYDNVNSMINRRKEDIENQFPQVVSKLALLTVAGMEVNQAWELTSLSGTGVLYEEMNRVMIELQHNIAPTEAYRRFIVRCNNGYTTKLATAIIQNISKGNSQIVQLFRRLNDESWLEHKHSARRKGEKIQSKLLVPTMLMFIGILILVIIPVTSGFNM